jgi:adenine-specific DNA-methyltransferase
VERARSVQALGFFFTKPNACYWIRRRKCRILPLMAVKVFKSSVEALRSFNQGLPAVMFIGDSVEMTRRIPDGSVDLTITSPPYCMGKAYEKSRSVKDFIAAHKAILPEIVRITREGGSICWQVGYHVIRQSAYPLDYAVFSILNDIEGVTLRNRLIWTFGFGMHQTRRFSGRHETVLWFTKGTDYFFDLDAVRTPQKYPGKRRYKGPRKGEFSCNPKGKNPGDVWEIPNVKAAHVEKVAHPCQFPVGLPDRLVRAMCPKHGIVFDPYMGSASTGVAAIVNGRRFLGAEVNQDYGTVAYNRLLSAHNGTAPVRPVEKPLYVASPRDAVARRPEHFSRALQ